MVSGALGGGAQPANDGTDTDGDGTCNAGDGDDDGDGVADGSDAAPLDQARCADGDSDGCDDGAISGASGGGAQGILGAEWAEVPRHLAWDLGVWVGALEIRESVQFGNNDARIAASSHELLRSVASVLAQHPEVSGIEVAGHTDDRGGEAFNQALSQRRAEAVVAFLVSAGVATDRLVAKGYGEARPREPASTDDARARNRRVEFVITARNAAVTTPAP